MKKIKIVLVSLFTPKLYPTIGFPISVETLSGDLRKRYKNLVEVKILDMQLGLREKEVANLIKKNNPDIIGLSVKTGDHQVTENILNQMHSYFTSDSLQSKYIVLDGHRMRVLPESDIMVSRQLFFAVYYYLV